MSKSLLQEDQQEEKEWLQKRKMLPEKNDTRMKTTIPNGTNYKNWNPMDQWLICNEAENFSLWLPW